MVRYFYDTELRCIVSYGTEAQDGVFKTPADIKRVRHNVSCQLSFVPSDVISIIWALLGYGQTQIEFGPSFVAVLDIWSGRVHYFGPSGSDRLALQTSGFDHFGIESSSGSLAALKYIGATSDEPEVGCSAQMLSVTRVGSLAPMQTSTTLLRVGNDRVVNIVPSPGSFLLHFASGWFCPAWNNHGRLEYYEPDRWIWKAQRLWANTSVCLALLIHRFHGSCLLAWGNATSGGRVPLVLADAVQKPSDVQRVVCTRNAFALLLWTGQVFPWGSRRYGGEVPAGLCKDGLELADLRFSDVWPVYTDPLGSEGFMALRSGQAASPLVLWGGFAGEEVENGSEDAKAVSQRSGWLTIPAKNLAAVSRKLQEGLAFQKPFSNLYGIFLLFNDGCVVPVLEHSSVPERKAAQNRETLSSSNINTPAPGSSFCPMGRLVNRQGASVISFAAVCQDIQLSGGAVSLLQTDRAFCAVLKSGEAVSWGVRCSGGGLKWPGPFSCPCGGQKDSFAITASQNSFAAVAEDGKVLCWGREDAIDRFLAKSDSVLETCSCPVVGNGTEAQQDRFQIRGLRARNVWGSPRHPILAAELENGQIAIWGDLSLMPAQEEQPRLSTDQPTGMKRSLLETDKKEAKGIDELCAAAMQLLQQSPLDFLSGGDCSASAAEDRRSLLLVQQWDEPRWTYKGWKPNEEYPGAHPLNDALHCYGGPGQNPEVIEHLPNNFMVFYSYMAEPNEANLRQMLEIAKDGMDGKGFAQAAYLALVKVSPSGAIMVDKQSLEPIGPVYSNWEERDYLKNVVTAGMDINDPVHQEVITQVEQIPSSSNFLFENARGSRLSEALMKITSNFVLGSHEVKKVLVHCKLGQQILDFGIGPFVSKHVIKLGKKKCSSKKPKAL